VTLSEVEGERARNRTKKNMKLHAGNRDEDKPKYNHPPAQGRDCGFSLSSGKAEKEKINVILLILSNEI